MRCVLSLAMLLLLLPASVTADSITTADGTTYKSVTLIDKDALSITLRHRSGIVRIPFAELTFDDRQRYGYDAKAAAAANRVLAARAKAAAAKRAQEQRRRRVKSAIAAADSSGSGFLISEDGLVLTCFHVIAEAAEIAVFHRGNVYDARVIRAHEKYDLAVLKVAMTGTPVRLASYSRVRLGQTIFVVGYPNILIQGLQPKLTKGTIGSLRGYRDSKLEYQISAAIQGGNSGGPVADDKGNVIGVVVSSLDDSWFLHNTGQLPQNVNYAVRLPVLISFLGKHSKIVRDLRESAGPPPESFVDAVDEVRESTVLILVTLESESGRQ